MKRTFSAILCAMLLMGTMTACGNGGNSGSGGNSSAGNSSGSSASSNTDAELPESIDMTIYMPIFNETPPETTVVGQRWTEMMEEHVGTKLNITWEEVSFGDYLQKISVYLASGDWADIFNFTGAQKDQQMELGQTGMLLCLDDYAEYTPNLLRYSAEGNNRKNNECADGKLYGVPQLAVNSFTGGGQSCFAIRKDVFDAYDIPYPQTLEDVYTAAKKLKEIYPNSYPITSEGAVLLNQLYNINRTSYSTYYDGEKYAFGPTDGGKLRDIVEYLSKLYAEGLLDPEYATQTKDAVFEKCLNDKAFIAPHLYALYITDNINAASDTVEWMEIAYPTGTQGETPWITGALREGNVLSTGYDIVINAKTKYPEVMAQIVDYQLSDEMVELCTWGVEGVTYNRDSSGNPVYIDEITSNANPMSVMAEYGLYASMACRPGIAFMPDSKEGYFYIFPKMPSWTREEILNVNSWEFYTTLNDKGINVAPDETPALSFNEESQFISTNRTAINTFVEESIAKFIAGERPMSEWDAFVEEIANYGDYQGLLDLYNQKLEAFNAQ